MQHPVQSQQEILNPVAMEKLLRQLLEPALQLRELPRLLHQHPLHNVADHIGEGGGGGQLEDREAQLIREFQRPRRNLIDITFGFDPERGHSLLVQLGNNLGDQLRPVMKGEAACNQELSRTDPVNDIGNLHYIDPVNITSKAPGPSQQGRFLQVGNQQDIAAGQTGNYIAAHGSAAFTIAWKNRYPRLV